MLLQQFLSREPSPGEKVPTGFFGEPDSLRLQSMRKILADFP